MLTVEKRTGIVPANSKLPLWKDIFPALVDPTKLQYRDDFEMAGPMEGALLPLASPPRGWANPSAVKMTKSGGAVRPLSATSQGAAFSRIDTGFANGEAMFRFNLGAAPSGVVALLVRTQDGANCIRVAVQQALLAIQYYSGGASQPTSTTAVLALAQGTDYTLHVRYEGDTITARVADVVAKRVVSGLISETGLGIEVTSPLHAISDLYVASL